MSLVNGSECQFVETLARITRRAAEICEQFKIAAIGSQVDACQKLLAQGNTINVVVVGNFKAGKSSFLNGLVGASLLPVGVLPVTAVITRLRYGEFEKASVQFLDGRSHEVSLTGVGAYIVESQNPANSKQVADVLIETPTLKPYEGLQFVDTPGLNSAFLHNSETSRNWLPQVGTALLTTSADHPLSEQDTELLKELFRFTPKVVILLTKVDLLNRSQTEEVISFVRERTKALPGDAVPIFPYSIRQDAISHRELLDRELFLPLVHKRSSEAEHIMRHKVRALILDCLDYLNIGLAAATRNEDDRAWLRDQIVGDKNSFATISEELRLIERDCMGHTRSFVDDIVSRYQVELRRRLVSQLRSQFAAWKLNLWEFSRAYEAWLNEKLGQEIQILSKREQSALATPLQNAERRFSRVLENFKNALAVDIERTLGVKLSPAQWEGTIKIPESPDISISPAFDIQIDLVWYLVPMAVFGPMVRRRFLRRVSWEVEKNLSRLTAQWTEAIDCRIHELRQQGEVYVKSEIQTIESLLALRPSVASALKQARDELLQARE
jgi:GTP-binding protein EngB required for normal cell division